MLLHGLAGCANSLVRVFAQALDWPVGTLWSVTRSLVCSWPGKTIRHCAYLAAAARPLSIDQCILIRVWCHGIERPLEATDYPLRVVPSCRERIFMIMSTLKSLCSLATRSPLQSSGMAYGLEWWCVCAVAASRWQSVGGGGGAECKCALNIDSGKYCFIISPFPSACHLARPEQIINGIILIFSLRSVTADEQSADE